MCNNFEQKDAKAFLFDINNVIMVCVLLCLILTYTLHYLVRRHEGLLKKHHKIFQIISRIRLILFFMAVLPYFCGKRCMIFLKTEGKPLFFSVIN